jgi:hypothetical protein
VPSRLLLEVDVGGACPLWSRTMKQASVSSTDHGGGPHAKKRIAVAVV